MEIPRKNNLIAEVRLNQGFTIIELMTVMVIIAVITAFAVSNYRLGNRQVVLDMQANQFAHEARKAQEWALAAHQVGGASQYGYGVYFAKGGSYIIFVDTNNDGYYTAGFDEHVQTVNLDNNLEIAACSLDSLALGPASVDNASVNFIPPNPTTKIGNSGQSYDEAVVTFKIKNMPNTRQVTINRAGLIYVE